jgi:hypothetical protein
MDYLFTEKDTIIWMCFIVYAAMAFLQFQKMIIVDRASDVVDIRQGIWLCVRVIFILPLLWTVNFLT